MKIWLVMLILLVGCGKSPNDVDLIINTSSENFTQITAKPVDDDKIPVIGGKDADDIIAIYTVPASTIPTVIYVYDDVKKPFRPRKKDEAKKPVSTVSSNEEVQVYYPEVTPWWYWWLGYIAIAGIVYFLGNKYISIISKPLGWIRKIYGIFKR